MYGLSSLNVEDYPSINEQIKEYDVLLYSKAYPVVQPIFWAAYTSGVYTMILLSIERYFAICQRKFLSLKDIKIYSACIVLMSIIYCIPTCWENTWETKEFPSGNFTVPAKTDLFRDKSSAFFRIYKLGGGLIVHLLIPFISLVPFNFLIIKKV